MKRIKRLKPQFVGLMPSNLESGWLYISTEYLLTAHVCACGCGEKVVLPLHPQQWQFTFDGADISMWPSVGNVGTACNSHYWIRQGRIDWAPTINADRALRGFERDRRDLREKPNLSIAQEDEKPSNNGRPLHRLARHFRKK